jgi:NYN domain
MAKAAVTYRLAVLIDADNTSLQIAAGLFAAVAKLGEASVRRIYGDFSGTRLKSWAETLAAYAIVPHQAFANSPGKNASDIALVIDAMDLLHTGRFDGFCLVSSDSDFTRLAARIREQGLAVYGFGAETTPLSFRQACKQFFDMETLVPKPPKPKTKKAAKLPLLESDDPFTLPLQIPAAAPEPQPAPAPPSGPVTKPIGATADLLQRAVADTADKNG